MLALLVVVVRMVLAMLMDSPSGKASGYLFCSGVVVHRC